MKLFPQKVGVPWCVTWFYEYRFLQGVASIGGGASFFFRNAIGDICVIAWGYSFSAVLFCGSWGEIGDYAFSYAVFPGRSRGTSEQCTREGIVRCGITMFLYWTYGHWYYVRSWSSSCGDSEDPVGLSGFVPLSQTVSVTSLGYSSVFFYYSSGWGS